MELKISDNWTAIPVSKEIFGHFFESGFGRQVSGMWSEMIYNRAFRKITPYKKATWEWLGLDSEHYNENMPSWHSGYEEHDWEAFGEPTMRHLVGSRTFKGTTALRVFNEKRTCCGLKQKGIHLKKGQSYIFTILIGVEGHINQAGLNGFGITKHTDAKYPVNVKIGNQEKEFMISTITEKYFWEFTSDETGVLDISIGFGWEGAIILSCVSLMPSDNIEGWRKDVVECMKEIAPPVIRFPGGCFVSFYNWRSSIGDRDAREPMESFYWGGLEENDVGIDEFLALSRLVGFRPQICFNMMTSTPFEARQMVEYLNASEDAGMGRLRKLNGNPEPYGVRLFEMDNEPGRKWTALQYAHQCVAFAREMRLADERIEMMIAAYEYPVEILRDMLDICGKDIQYVIYRQGNPEFVRKVLPVIREYNKDNGTSIRMANTEWLASCSGIEPFEDSKMPMNFSWSGKVTNDYRDILGTFQISWNYALNGAHRLLDYISYGGEFALANFNNFCNTWGQNVIEATKDDAYLSCMGEVFRWFNRRFSPCIAAKVETGNQGLYALAVRRSDGQEGIYVINHSSAAVKVKLPDGNWVSGGGLKGRGRMAHMAADRSCVEPFEAKIEGTNAVFEAISLTFITGK